MKNITRIKRVLIVLLSLSMCISSGGTVFAEIETPEKDKDVSQSKKISKDDENPDDKKARDEETQKDFGNEEKVAPKVSLSGKEIKNEKKQKNISKSTFESKAGNKKDSRLEDGIYVVNARIFEAGKDNNSDGSIADRGLLKPVNIIVVDGVPYLRMAWQGIEVSGQFAYLGTLSYFKDYHHKIAPPDTDAKAMKSTVENVFKNVKDRFNKKNSKDKIVRGKEYPKIMSMPVKKGVNNYWLKMYIPAMAEFGMGYTKARLYLDVDWDNLSKAKADDVIPIDPKAIPRKVNDDNKPNKPKKPHRKHDGKSRNHSGNRGKKPKKQKKQKFYNINKLKDGIYLIRGELLNHTRAEKSMANAAFNHNVKLTVKKEKVYLTLNFQKMESGGFSGYLGKMWYFKSGYRHTYGGPVGSYAPVKVESYQTHNGKRISDKYGTDYPDKISFPLIPEAKKNGYVPLKSMVPVMERISPGNGIKSSYLKLDIKHIQKPGSNDIFEKDEKQNSDIRNKSIKGMKGGSGLGGISALKAALKKSKLKKSKLLGDSKFKDSNYEKEEKTHYPEDKNGQPPLRKHVIPGILWSSGILAGVLVILKRRFLMGLIS